MRKILDSWPVQLFMTILTIYALFFDDIRILYIPKVADNAFYAITTFCLICFMTEIILASYSKKEYWCKFFFWLDLLSTISLVTDIGWLMDLLVSDVNGILSVAKTSWAGWITWVVWVIRLIWLIWIVKLYK